MIIKGNIHADHRGTVRFVNDFGFDGVKRFYTITHPDTEIIRGWQGHKLETKHFYSAKGSFRISWIEIDHWDNPSQDLKVHSKVLTDQESEILVIKPGHATAIQALTPGSTLVVFSNLTLEESKRDDYRFDANFWQIEH